MPPQPLRKKSGKSVKSGKNVVFGHLDQEKNCIKMQEVLKYGRGRKERIMPKPDKSELLEVELELDGGIELSGELAPVRADDAALHGARLLYVYEEASVKECADKFGLSVRKLNSIRKREGWDLERKIHKSGVGEKVIEAMEKFANSKELSLVTGYYELQEEALNSLKKLLKADDLNINTVGAVLEVAEKGVGLGERVLARANPKRARDLAETLTLQESALKPNSAGVQVNVLAAALRTQE